MAVTNNILYQRTWGFPPAQRKYICYTSIYYITFIILICNSACIKKGVSRALGVYTVLLLVKSNIGVVYFLQ